MEADEFELQALRAEIINKLDCSIKIQASMCAAVALILAYLLSADSANMSHYSFLTVLCITIPCHIIIQDMLMGAYKISAYLIVFHPSFKWEARLIDFGSHYTMVTRYKTKFLNNIDASTFFVKFLSYISLFLFALYPHPECKYIILAIVIGVAMFMLFRCVRFKDLKKEYINMWTKLK